MTTITFDDSLERTGPQRCRVPASVRRSILLALGLLIAHETCGPPRADMGALQLVRASGGNLSRGSIFPAMGVARRWGLVEHTTRLHDGNRRHYFRTTITGRRRWWGACRDDGYRISDLGC